MLDKFHYHEVLDRIHVMQSMLEDHIQSHPATLANPRLAITLTGTPPNDLHR